MDVLGDAVAVMRTGRPVSARLAWRSPWGQRFATVPGAAGIQVVMRGECWLIPDSGPPVRLCAGDVLLMPHGRGHALADSPSTPLRPCPAPVSSPPARASSSQAPPSPPSLAISPPSASSLARALPIPDPLSDAEPDGVVLCGAYELQPDRAHPLLDDLPDLVHLRARPRLRPVIDLLGAELERGEGSAEVGVSALLDLLFLHALRAWFETLEESGEPEAAGAAAGTALTGWPAALRDPAVGAALKAIHREPNRPWTVAELAAVGGLSRAPFARRFATLTGRAPLSYLTWWRMTVAARLLRDSDAPLRTVAYRVGYASEFAFAAAFKRRFGVAPGRFRRAA
ncbi:AraC family transcriptional regulator [Dactylosporangium sp. CA-139066]|uniref:AraC family transcriptional regulator n=1 Tax=Dactylosporangium sp. CA-139066 TaxID=3239930 RepID=UPI003D8B2D8F